MPRLARKILEGKQFIHVMVQGINKEKIFFEEREKLEYLKLLNKYKDEHDITIIAYCVMDNHVHILISTEKIENLTKCMQKVNTSYGMYYNKNRNRVGYVYKDRFKTQVISNEKHLYNCIIYIHNNPVKAHMCKSVDEYKYSSYKDFLSKENKELLIKIFENKIKYIESNKIENLEDMGFLEDENDTNINIINTINDYYVRNETNNLEIRLENKLLNPIVLELKKVYNLTNIKISKYLGVSKYKIDKILNNKQ